MANGFLLWRGASQLDGKPIVLIATGYNGTRNSKTGAMIQTYVLREDLTPIEAVKSKADASICGDCRHRNSTCYVAVFQGPTAVFSAYKRGNYPTVDLRSLHRAGKGHAIRLGSYGDPAAVPFNVWTRLLREADTHTGYTHQWRTCDANYKEICMASVDNDTERLIANGMGWRTFRVRPVSEGPLTNVSKREVVCPASAEAGHRTTCSECRACGGLTSKARADIVITAHGARGRSFR